MMNNNESFYTAMLRVASNNYYPMKVPKTGLIPGMRTFEWRKEYEKDDDPNGDQTCERELRPNFQSQLDLLLTEDEVNSIIMSPETYMSVHLKDLCRNRQKDWELFVTEYRPQMAKVYNHQDADGQRKALRKAHLLSRMSPEDRALFEGPGR